MPSGNWWGGFGRSFPEGVAAGSRVMAVRAATQSNLLEQQQKQANDLLGTLKTDVENYVTYKSNIPNENAPEWLKNGAGANYEKSLLAHVHDIQSLLMQVSPALASSAGAYSNLVTGAKFKNQIETEKALASSEAAVHGADTTAAMLNDRQAPAPTGVGAPPAAAAPGMAVAPTGAPQPITPDGTLPPGAQAVPNGAGPAPVVQAPVQQPAGEMVTPDEIAEAKPAPVDPAERHPGHTYITGKGPMMWTGQGWLPVAPEPDAAPDYSVLNTEAAPVTAGDVLKVKEQKPVDPGTVRAIVEGRTPMPSLGRNSQNAGLIAGVMKADPTYTAQRYDMNKMWSTGPMATTRQAVNQMAYHAGEMERAFNDLNAHGFTSINKARNYFKGQVGENPVRAYEAAKQAFTEELRRAWAGRSGGTQAELDQWQESLDKADTPETFYNTMNTVSRLIMGTVESQKEKYRMVMGKSPPFLTTRARVILNYFAEHGDIGSIRLPSFQVPKLEDQPVTRTIEEAPE